VLVADKCIEAMVQGLLGRPKDLGIRRVEYKILIHPHHDPGCHLDPLSGLLLPVQRLYDRALVIFDLEGCGKEHRRSREDMEAEVETRLAQTEWRGRSAAIANDPEIEQWIWSPSSRVDAVLGWAGRAPSLREWLREKEHLREGDAKPARPKEAMKAALEAVGGRFSSALFKGVAEKVPLDGCVDPGFRKLRATLTRWFPEG